MPIRQKTRQNLTALQTIMQELALWQSVPPVEEAFLSEQPFAIDTMSATEWLQWIFIPRMHALLDSGHPLPSQIAISPYIEEALKEQERLSDLLRPIIEIEQLLKKSIMLEILYQDEYLVAVNKPAGMLVHRSWLDSHETQFVMQTLRDQIGRHVFPVHRLDRPTSGVLLFALNGEIANLLCQQFEGKTVEKSYLAVVRGYLTGAARIDYPLKIRRDKIADKFGRKEKEPQSAVTDYEGLTTVEMPWAVGKYQTSRYSLVRLTPRSGRKHQLRRHMKHIFHPILGDTQYGDLYQNRGLAEKTQVSRLMLHAEKLAFNHPITQTRLELQAGFDQQWQRLLQVFGWEN